MIPLCMFKLTSHRLSAVHSCYICTQSTSSVESSAGQTRANRTSMPQGDGRGSFVSLANGVKAQNTLLLTAAKFVISKIRQQITHADLVEIVPNLLYTDSRNIYLDLCLFDSDCQHDSYC